MNRGTLQFVRALVEQSNVLRKQGNSVICEQHVTFLYKVEWVLRHQMNLNA